MRRSVSLLISLVFFLLFSSHGFGGPPPEIIEARKIWDAAPHNAFTDLAHFQGRWYCVFREGQGHVSPDGALRVISSEDGQQWASAALLSSPTSDLRDPKIVVTPDSKLMLSGAAAIHQPAEVKHQSMVWFSDNGRTWSDPVEVGDPNVWLWRITWWRNRAYGAGYGTGTEHFVRLYSSKDGRRFDELMPVLHDEGYGNETSLVFMPDGGCYCLLRRDGELASAQLGFAQPPYKNWTWKDLGVQIGGPHMIRLPDGRLLAAVRLYQPARTSLAWVKPDSAELLEIMALPSGGDTSYAGMVWHDDLLWISYYSSHEGKTSIYLATVKLALEPAASTGNRP
jgi:hypothetical protein